MDCRIQDAYYSRTATGLTLVRAMGKLPTSRIVDLGAGRGCLSLAAVQSWPISQLTTVDSDASVAKDLIRSIAAYPRTKHYHYAIDALDVDLPAIVARTRSAFSAAVCNPPYRLSEWKQAYEQILQAASFPSSIQPRDLGASPIFLAQNLRLLQKGGCIGVIVPDWIVTGTAAAALRLWLTNFHGLSHVIQLPSGAFRGTETRAFVLVLRKHGGRLDHLVLQRADVNGEIKASLVLAQPQDGRLDFEYHSSKAVSRSSTTSLVSLKADIRRGTLPGKARKTFDRVFHTSDFPSHCDSVAFPSFGTLPPGNHCIAEPGDILLARVDRKLEEKVVAVSAGWAVLTDCVFRIRVPTDKRKATLSYLRSERGTEVLRSTARGTGARMLSKTELLRMPLELSDA